MQSVADKGSARIMMEGRELRKKAQGLVDGMWWYRYTLSYRPYEEVRHALKQYPKEIEVFLTEHGERLDEIQVRHCGLIKDTTTKKLPARIVLEHCKKSLENERARRIEAMREGDRLAQLRRQRCEQSDS